MKIITDIYNHKLSSAERNIVNTINELDIEVLATMSIIDISNHIGYTPSTVTKTLKKIGIGGWKQFQIYLSISRLKTNQKTPNKFINEQKLDKLANDIVQVIKNNGKIFLYAHGYTFNVASLVAHFFTMYGINCLAHEASNYLGMSYFSQNRINIFLSVSGETKFIKLIVSDAVKHPGINALITSNKSIINNELKYLFYIEQPTQQYSDLTNYLSYFELFDALLNKISKLQFRRKI